MNTLTNTPSSDELNTYFDTLVATYVDRFETIYLQKVNESDNKEYARAFYRSALFERNPQLPNDSYFFNALSRLFLHHYRLDKTTALYATFDQLYLISERTEMELATLEEISLQDDREFNSGLSDRIDEEYSLLSLEFSELTDLLACFLAIRLLLEKYPKNPQYEPFSLDAPLGERSRKAVNRKHADGTTFTQSQQVLSIYFLMYQIEVTPGLDVNLSDLARFIHLISNQTITKVDNSQVYKLLKSSFSAKREKKQLKDLKVILPYFERVGMKKATTLIRGEIQALSDDA